MKQYIILPYWYEERIIPYDEAAKQGYNVERCPKGPAPYLAIQRLRNKIQSIEQGIRWTSIDNPHLESGFPKDEAKTKLVEQYTAYYKRKLARIEAKHPEYFL